VHISAGFVSACNNNPERGQICPKAGNQMSARGLGPVKTQKLNKRFLLSHQQPMSMR
jgi:hypothetical protein